MKYQKMSFGKNKKRISLYHMNKPLSSGFVGMVTSNLFSENIAVIIDTSPENEYDFACLAWAQNGSVPRIKMTEEIYYDIKRGKPYARMILFHELGHYFHNDFLTQNEQSEEERFDLASQGRPNELEIRADSFAVEYLGVEIVAEGLDCLYNLVKYKYNEYDECDLSVVLKEIDIRKREICKRFQKTLGSFNS